MARMRTRLKNIWPVLALLPILGSCAQSYQSPESFRDKMNRYETPRERAPSVPKFSLLNVNFHQQDGSSSPGRNLASDSSASDQKQNKKLKPGVARETLAAYESWSNRKIYFLTLYYQYARFKNFISAQAPDIRYCPQFHTGVVENPILPASEGALIKDFFEKKYSFNMSSLSTSPTEQAIYPELSLPVTLENIHPTALEILSQDQVKNPQDVVIKAIQVHLQKTYEELADLCENGQGPNYFIFENYIGHVKEHPEFKESAPSMQALLKITLMANFNLLTSLGSYLPLVTSKRSSPQRWASGAGRDRHLASLSPGEGSNTYGELMQVVFNRLDANWSQIYFKELEKRKKERLIQDIGR